MWLRGVLVSKHLLYHDCLDWNEKLGVERLGAPFGIKIRCVDRLDPVVLFVNKEVVGCCLASCQLPASGTVRYRPK